MGQGSSRTEEASSSETPTRQHATAPRSSPSLLRRSDSTFNSAQRYLRFRPFSQSRQRQQANADDASDTLPSSVRRRARLSRRRISGLFSSNDTGSPDDRSPSSYFQGGDMNNGASRQYQTAGLHAPSIEMPNLDLPLEMPQLNTPTPLPPETPRLRPQRSPHSIADRISSLTPDRGFRSMTASLRRRRSPLRTSDDPSVALTRLLSLAAQATAASLLGRNAENAMADLRSPNGVIEGDDGTFNGFLQALQSGRFAAALNQGERSPPEESGDGEDTPTSFEFFRMFRFGTSNTPRRRTRDSSRPSSSRSAGHGSSHSADPGGTPDEDGGHRMVPILIVGVRALGETDEGFEGADGSVPSFFDALTGAPSTVSLGLSDDPTSDGVLPLPNERPRNSQRRRASMGGFNLFSHGRDSSRVARNPDTVRPQSAVNPLQPLETPPGPHPPPTTPSSPGLSAFSSGTSTPTRRSSFSTSGSLNTSSRRNSLIRRMAGTTLEPTAEESSSQPRFSRRRRDSEPDTERFGSGSSRRNGVLVEPGDSPAEGHRSWIIYILGGSYPENHPILTTPSLFTDSPTYEDMVLLSSLLGQAKPPVANAEDVASAGGLFRIRVADGQTTAVEECGEERLHMSPSAQCLVCLCGYQEDEEARRLVKCQHLFHRECIDQWLTTGRNSCPLCRGQGVDDKSNESSDNVPPETAQQAQAAA